jgi:hypothetical protein
MRMIRRILKICLLFLITFIASSSAVECPLGSGKITIILKNRNEMFRKAKIGAKIPLSAQPIRVRHVPLKEKGKQVFDTNRNPINTREYDFKTSDGKFVTVQEHTAGHYYSDTGSLVDPHFNVRYTETGTTVPGTDHYFVKYEDK